MNLNPGSGESESGSGESESETGESESGVGESEPGSGETEPGSAPAEWREDPVPNTTTIPRLVTPPTVGWLVGLGSYTMYIHLINDKCFSSSFFF